MMAWPPAPLPKAWTAPSPLPSKARSKPEKKIAHCSSTDDGSSFQRRYWSAT
jgi:hypothetical protein